MRITEKERSTFFALGVEIDRCSINSYLKEWGDTALTEAASNNNLDIIKILIDFGADPNQPGCVCIT